MQYKAIRYSLRIIIVVITGCIIKVSALITSFLFKILPFQYNRCYIAFIERLRFSGNFSTHITYNFYCCVASSHVNFIHILLNRPQCITLASFHAIAVPIIFPSNSAHQQIGFLAKNSSTLSSGIPCSLRYWIAG